MDHSLRRRIIAEAKRLCGSDESPDKVLELARDAFAHLRPYKREDEVTFAQMVEEKLERMENGTPDVDIIKTGLAKLDRNSPLRKGDFPLIVGVRKSGKSLLALSLVKNMAEAGRSVLYFSLEDRAAKVVDRLFAGVSRLPMYLDHVSKLGPDKIFLASQASSKLKALPITITDNCYELTDICAESRRLNRKGKADVIVIDYGQLVKASSQKDRRQEVELVSRTLRLLAMELGAPVIMLSQLNKDGETRESKAIEMDATACWQLEVDEKDGNKRYLKIPWQRNGESGISFTVTFLGAIARVEDYAGEDNSVHSGG